MKIATSYSEARELGLTRFFTGKPCKRNHIAERYASTGQCCVCIRNHSDNWKKVNIEQVREYARKRHWSKRDELIVKMREWREKNPEKQKKCTQAWRAKNPLRRREDEALRRAKKQKAGGRYTIKQIKDLAEKQKHKCMFCLASIKKSFHIDHVFPLSKSGSNDISNIQLLCQNCNQRKYNKDPIEFAQENNKLL